VTENHITKLLQNWNYVDEDMKVCTYTLQFIIASETTIYSFQWASMPVVSSITMPSSRSSGPSYGRNPGNSLGSSQIPSTTSIVYLRLLRQSFVGRYMRQRDGEKVISRQPFTAHTMRRRCVASHTSGAWSPTMSN